MNRRELWAPGELPVAIKGAAQSTTVWEWNGRWWVNSYKGREGKEGGADSLGQLLE